MTRRRTLPILLALTLLVTQAAGYAHGLSHFRADTPVKERIAHDSLCAKCASFDKLSLILPTSPPLDLRADPPRASELVVVESFQKRVTTPFQPRAPPHFV